MLSVKVFFNNIFKIVRTYPIELLFAFIWTISLFILSGNYQYLSSDLLQNVLMVSVLWFFTNLSVTLFFAKEWYKNTYRYLLYLIILSLLILYYYLLPSSINDFTSNEIIHYFVLLSASFLSVFFVPFLQDPKIENFWVYSVWVLKSIMISSLYWFILFVGLSIVLLSLDYLFWLKVLSEYYLQLWTIVVWVFMSIFFLWNISTDNNSFQIEKYENKYVLILWKYILFSLMLVYLLILYVYWLKITITWNWPNWMVVLLIFWYTVIWFSHYMLMRLFYKNESTSVVIKYQFDIFFYSLLPLVWLFYYALWLRISDYWFTVNRVFVIFYWIFMILWTLSYIISKSKNIKHILYLIFSILILSVVWPWSAFNIWKVSQLNRLEIILSDNSILQDWKVVTLKQDLLDEQTKDNIFSILDYMIDYHGYDSIKHIFLKDINTLNQDQKLYSSYISRNTIVISLMKQMWLNTKYWLDVVDNLRYDFFAKDNNILLVWGYNYVLNVDLYNKWMDIESFYKWDSATLSWFIIDFDYNKNSFNIYKDSELKKSIDLSKYFSELISTNEMNNYNEISLSKLSFTIDWFKIVFYNLSLIKGEKSIQVQNLNWKLLLPENL